MNQGKRRVPARVRASPRTDFRTPHQGYGRPASGGAIGLSRREALGLFGATGALLLACEAERVSGRPIGGSVSCVLNPSTTPGPYWIDERLNRSDIRSDSSGLASPNPRPGLPLILVFTVLAYDGGSCSPLSGAQVDVWHCDGSGIYSEVSNIGGTNTSGQNFLRGYQVTDASGAPPSPPSIQAGTPDAPSTST